LILLKIIYANKDIKSKQIAFVNNYIDHQKGKLFH